MKRILNFFFGFENPIHKIILDPKMSSPFKSTLIFSSIWQSHHLTLQLALGLRGCCSFCAPRTASRAFLPLSKCWDTWESKLKSLTFSLFPFPESSFWSCIKQFKIFTFWKGRKALTVFYLFCCFSFGLTNTLILWLNTPVKFFKLRREGKGRVKQRNY